MLVLILTLLDLISFANLSLVQFGFEYSNYLLFVSGLYFIGKGILFRDVMSIIDSVCGFYILLVFWFGWASFFYYLVFVWIAYKMIPTMLNFLS